MNRLAGAFVAALVLWAGVAQGAIQDAPGLITRDGARHVQRRPRNLSCP